MKMILLLISLLSFTPVRQSPQQPAPEPPVEEETETIGINWMSWDDAVAASQKEKRKIVVDVYTEWCGWCKRMDELTFSDPKVIEQINEKYYAVKFDAEQKGDIVFNGQTYSFVNHGRRGYHELAAEITKGRLSYPTIVFLNEDFELIQSIPGFQNATDFEIILSYFSGNFHMTTPWNKYKENYQSGK